MLFGGGELLSVVADDWQLVHGSPVGLDQA